MEPKRDLKALAGLKHTAQPRAQRPAAPVPEPAQSPAAGLEPAQSGGVGSNLTIRAPRTLLDAYEAHKKQTGISYPNILFNEIEATYDQLPELLGRNQVKTPGTNLFGRPEAVPVVERDDSAKDTKAMRISPAHMKVLDRLAGELTSGNRNRLIVTALDAYLTQQ